MSLILSFKNLSIGYGKTLLAKNLNIELHSGEVLLLCGSNGSGKTTLVKTLLGETPALSGDIECSAKSIYYFRQSYEANIHFPITVGEILDKKDHVHNMESDLKWNELSGGQKQRVLIYKIFSENHDLIIMDEPLNHLDENTILDFHELIEEQYQKNPNMTLVIISHQEIELKSLRANNKVKRITL